MLIDSIASVYVYAILDLWSRKIVGWEVHEREAGEWAAELIEKAAWREHLRQRPLILHADFGRQRAYGSVVSHCQVSAELSNQGLRGHRSSPGMGPQAGDLVQRRASAQRDRFRAAGPAARARSFRPACSSQARVRGRTGA